MAACRWRGCLSAPRVVRQRLTRGSSAHAHSSCAWWRPVSEQPIVRAVLVPIATYGATVGAQYLRFGS
jgi:hypothetical protein